MFEVQAKLAKRRELYASAPKEPLYVKLKMRTPIAVSDYVMLDALLVDRVIADIFSGPIPAGEVIHTDKIEAPLPLEERGTKHRYWAASAGVLDCPYAATVTWHKRWHEDDDWVRFRGAARVSHKSGHFRSYAMPLRIVPAAQIEFWAVGWKQELARLLGGLTVIGKKRSQGLGEVRAVEVETWHEDWSCVCEGSAMRPIPVSELDAPLEAKVHYMPWRPPYWNTIEGNMTECYVP